MFDRTHISHITESPDTINIHEHKAPTDESVRLLREMEESVQKKIEASMRLNANSFEFKVTIYRVCDMSQGELNIIVQFLLNERRCRFEHVYDSIRETPEELLNILQSLLIKSIATEIIPDLANAMIADSNFQSFIQEIKMRKIHGTKR